MRIDLRRDLGAFARAIDSMLNCCLVVIDPVSAFLTPGGGSKAERTSIVLSELAHLAYQSHVAVLGVMMINQLAENPRRGSPLDNLGCMAAARGAWSIARDPKTDIRWLAPIKQNLRVAGGGLAFRIGNDSEGQPRLEWNQKIAERHVHGIEYWPSIQTVRLGGEQPAGQTPRLGWRRLSVLTKEQRALLARIRRRGGRITVRAVMRSTRQYPTAAAARAALDALVEAGRAVKCRQAPSARGGRSAEVYEIMEDGNDVWTR